MKVICFAATLFVILFVCDASDDPKCKEGETFEKECNTCTCTSAGKFVCTLKACYDGPQFPDTEPLSTTVEPAEEHTEISETNGQVCTPNETKMQDCNRCKCSANGIVWICTRRLCLPTSSPKIPVNEPGFTCSPNQAFMDDCNTCSCDESGKLARCTAMACDPIERQKRSDNSLLLTTTEVPLPKGTDCVAGTRWKQECNWCWCSDNGFAACTLKGCLGPHQQKFHPHKFHPKIETTTLSDTTTVQETKVFETNKVKRNCSPEKTTKNQNINVRGSSNQAIISQTPLGQESSTQKPSAQNSTISSGIKTTSAPVPHNYVSTSNLEYTEAEISDPNFKCTPSSSFKVACNTCWCSATGAGVRFCTRQACKPKTYPTLAPQ